MPVMALPWALGRGVAHPMTVGDHVAQSVFPAHNPGWEITGI